MLQLPKGKRVLRKETIGTTTILQYDVYPDGSYSQPTIISSYNFVPQARKKQIKAKKPKMRIKGDLKINDEVEDI